MASEWTGRGKVRARAITSGAEIAIDGITTQARYYKPLVYEFFRKEFPVRPKAGEFEDAGGEIEHRIDAGELVEERDQECQQDWHPQAPGPKPCG